MFNGETRLRGKKDLRPARATFAVNARARISAFLGSSWRNEGATNWHCANRRKDRRRYHRRLLRNRWRLVFLPFQASEVPERTKGCISRRIEGDRMRAGSLGLGQLGLGFVALCLVEAVDQRFDDEFDR